LEAKAFFYWQVHIIRLTQQKGNDEIYCNTAVYYISVAAFKYADIDIH
jgi:hypothetical protein